MFRDEGARGNMQKVVWMTLCETVVSIWLFSEIWPHAHWAARALSFAFLFRFVFEGYDRNAKSARLEPDAERFREEVLAALAKRGRA